MLGIKQAVIDAGVVIILVAVGGSFDDYAAERRSCGDSGKVITPILERDIGTVDPVVGLTVKAYRDTGSGYRWVRDAYTDASGDYTLPGLREGDYKISFYDPSGVYIREWYDDVPTITGATVIDVQPGGAVSNINGTVTDGT